MHTYLVNSQSCFKAGDSSAQYVVRYQSIASKIQWPLDAEPKCILTQSTTQLAEYPMLDPTVPIVITTRLVKSNSLLHQGPGMIKNRRPNPCPACVMCCWHWPWSCWQTRGHVGGSSALPLQPWCQPGASTAWQASCALHTPAPPV